MREMTMTEVQRDEAVIQYPMPAGPWLAHWSMIVLTGGLWYPVYRLARRRYRVRMTGRTWRP